MGAPTRGQRIQGGGRVNLALTQARRPAAIVAVLALVLSACSAAATPRPAAPAQAATRPASAPASQAAAATSAAPASKAPCGTVNIAVNPWVGYEADEAVVAYVLKNELGCTVVKKNINEQTSWQGFPTGEVDVILENWGHEDLAAKYITTDKVAQDGGPDRQRGDHRLVRPEVLRGRQPDDPQRQDGPDGPEQVRRPVQDVGVRRARASSSTVTRRSSRTTRA